MGLSGDLRASRLARLAKPMNAVLLLLVTSLVVHWGLASSLASTKEATRSNAALERITPVEAENHLALLRGGAQSVTLFLADQRLPATSANMDDRDADRGAPRDFGLAPNSYAAVTALPRLAPIVGLEKPFQARAPPAT
jgi:hypothetical protein